jgi:hypothetical protein
MEGRDFVAQLERAKTRASSGDSWSIGISFGPGSVRTAEPSAREEAGGSTGRRRPEQTLERKKPMRDAVREEGHELFACTDVAGGSNPLKRPIAGCEGAAFGCQRIARGSWKVLSRRSRGSSGGVTSRWKPHEGKAGRKAAPLPGDGSSEGRIPGTLQTPAPTGGALRGSVRSKAPRADRTPKAQWAGLGNPARSVRAPDAARIQEALKGNETPWEVARVLRHESVADARPRTRRPSRVMR